MAEAFLRAAECWLPSGGGLTLRSGAYGGLSGLREASSAARFEFGEGLPGCIWSSDKPQVWSAAETYVGAPRGVDAVAGFPVASGGRAGAAVVTLWCGSGDERGGCVECWELDPSVDQYRHAAGYYGGLEPFAELSPHIRFDIGRGLPGMTAKRGLPTLIEDTRRSSTFMRSEIARECGIAAGLGIPVYRAGRVAHVLVLLAAENRGLAKGVEVWVPSHSGSMALEQAVYGAGMESFAEASRGARVRAGQDIVGKVSRSELPAAWPVLEPPAFLRYEEAARCGVTSAVAIPILDGTTLLAALLLLN